MSDKNALVVFGVRSIANDDDVAVLLGLELREKEADLATKRNLDLPQTVKEFSVRRTTGWVNHQLGSEGSSYDLATTIWIGLEKV